MKKMKLSNAILNDGLDKYAEENGKEWLDYLFAAANLRSLVVIELFTIAKKGRYSISVNGLHVDTRFTIEFAKRRHKQLRNILMKKGYTVV